MITLHNVVWFCIISSFISIIIQWGYFKKQRKINIKYIKDRIQVNKESGFGSYIYVGYYIICPKNNKGIYDTKCKKCPYFDMYTNINGLKAVVCGYEKVHNKRLMVRSRKWKKQLNTM